MAPPWATELAVIDGLSLGWQTDLIFARFDGVVSECADCVVVRTPANPRFYWGNCLILPRPPLDADLAHWLARFEQEVGRFTTESGHVAIGYDALAPHPPLLAWAAAGFEIHASETLRLRSTDRRVQPMPLAPEFEFRAIDLSQAAEFAAVLDLQCAAMAQGFEPAGYRLYRELQMRRYAAMQRADLGHWFGIWRGADLLADCGLFHAAQAQLALGRFQHVSTHPAWRRRGLCTALISATLQHGFAQMGLLTLVMCADPDDVAIGIYESLGFARVSRAFAAQRRAPRDLGVAHQVGDADQ
ncbi:GNAT family protein [Paucibacter sp. AS339]|uniref:GNAT family N-acetyltransferase n=1 Tax=Paucibacter hankyongi TaxID=3133434 RepID=UPI0030A77322